MPSNCPADPFADPKTDPCNPLEYIPSNVLTTLALVLILSVAIGQTVSMIRWGAKYMLAMTIAVYTFAAGIGLRYSLHHNPDTKGIFIAEDLLIILSPCGFIAANYMLMGRLARSLRAGNYLFVSPQRIGRFFVLSDVVTFLIQAFGGSLGLSDNLHTAKTGTRIAQVGLIAQTISFLFFVFVFAFFLYRLRRNEPATWSRDRGLHWTQNWHALASAMAISCLGIIIRSIYRTIEFSQGARGRLSTDEALFYALDTLPLWFSIAVYVAVWPGRYITAESLRNDVEQKSIPLNNVNSGRR